MTSYIAAALRGSYEAGRIAHDHPLRAATNVELGHFEDRRRGTRTPVWQVFGECGHVLDHWFAIPDWRGYAVKALPKIRRDMALFRNGKLRRYRCRACQR
jgi:hypothetical protein